MSGVRVGSQPPGGRMIRAAARRPVRLLGVSVHNLVTPEALDRETGDRLPFER